MEMGKNVARSTILEHFGVCSCAARINCCASSKADLGHCHCLRGCWNLSNCFDTITIPGTIIFNFGHRVHFQNGHQIRFGRLFGQPFGKKRMFGKHTFVLRIRCFVDFLQLYGLPSSLIVNHPKQVGDEFKCIRGVSYIDFAHGDGQHHCTIDNIQTFWVLYHFRELLCQHFGEKAFSEQCTHYGNYIVFSCSIHY